MRPTGRLRGLLAAILLTLCAAARAEPLPVVASFSILGDLVRQIGGERVRVHTLVGAGADAHGYQPRPDDARHVADARLVVTNGLGFDDWIVRLLRAASSRAQVVVASQGIDASRPPHRGSGHQHHHDELDPHAWQDPANGIRYAENIARALARLDPAHAEHYHQRAGRYSEQIRALDERIRERLAGLPATRRRVVSSHDAFAYLGRAYGIEFISAVGVGNAAQPSAAQIAALIRLIRREGVAALFVENVADPRLIEQIRRETGARIGGRLYSDALTGANGEAPGYLELLAHNLETLGEALQEQ